MNRFFKRHPGWSIAGVLLLGVLLYQSGRYIVFHEVDENAVTPQQAHQLLQSQQAVMIDVRQPQEYRAGHVSGAKLVPLGELDKHLDELEPYRDQPLIVICHSGNRSTLASLKLMNAGFKQVHNLRGGILAWQRAGLPVVKKQ